MAYMKIPGVHIKKLDDISKPVIHLGNEPGTKAYRLLDPQSNKIFVSRDVAFEEKKTWPWDQHGEENHDQQTMFVVVGTDVQNSEEIVVQGGEESFESQQTSMESENKAVTPSTKGSTPMTPQMSVNTDHSESASSDSSSEPRRYKSLADIYNETEEIELDDELPLMGIDEPRNYSEAAKERSWRSAMLSEMESIEQNMT